jgi:uroporphyrin-III C-methyltransferase
VRENVGSKGKVYLIGAGPGAEDLITLRAVRALAASRIVLVDALVNRALLRHCAPGVRVIEVGKRAGCRSTPQAFIQRLMLRFARQGWPVARLKGGDAFVFGRGGEEFAFLRAHGIEVEVVPGLTAGIAVPATLGIPVTQRGIAHAVTFVTGHASGDREPDWRALVHSGTTLVVYMGLQRLETIVRNLVAAGLSTATPVAVIARGTLPDASCVCAPLAGIVAAVAAGSIAAPALIVIGEVVALAARAGRPACLLDFREALPAMEAMLP